MINKVVSMVGIFSIMAGIFFASTLFVSAQETNNNNGSTQTTTNQAQTPANSAISAACDGIELTGGSCATDSKGSVKSVLNTVIDVFSIIVGFVSVLMIMIGGFKYITSTGDSSSTASAKNTILYAIIGLVIVLSAQLIVTFVISKL